MNDSFTIDDFFKEVVPERLGIPSITDRQARQLARAFIETFVKTAYSRMRVDKADLVGVDAACMADMLAHVDRMAFDQAHEELKKYSKVETYEECSHDASMYVVEARLQVFQEEVPRRKPLKFYKDEPTLYDPQDLIPGLHF